jgi:glycerate-2-kinase
VNEPTAEGVEGARRILEIVGALTHRDLCLVLISGGGSALLPAPKPPITLEDKQAVTRFLMHAGAPIQALNTVRKRLSQIKGGGLARASEAGHTIALIISDIVGDPLELIASGPTYPDPATDADALAVLQQFSARPPDVPQRVLRYLEQAAGEKTPPTDLPETVSNHIIGSNAVALAAARRKAEHLGYHVISLGSDNCGEANGEGRDLAERCRKLRDGEEAAQLPTCILSGGEPVVHIAKTDKPRRGGRNQQLVLAGIDVLKDVGMDRIVLLSGGTDGEDGPTDAAGACADAELLRRIKEQQLDPQPYLAINDSYGFLAQVDGLLLTGPTHTNVMDLRVALIGSDKT